MFGVSRRDVVIYVEILLCCFFGIMQQL